MAIRTPGSASSPELVATLETIDARLRWLAAWTIHHANHLRDSRDGLKVGGHQASCASISTIMTALYFAALGANACSKIWATKRTSARFTNIALSLGAELS